MDTFTTYEIDSSQTQMYVSLIGLALRQGGVSVPIRMLGLSVGPSALNLTFQMCAI